MCREYAQVPSDADGDDVANSEQEPSDASESEDIAEGEGAAEGEDANEGHRDAEERDEDAEDDEDAEESDDAEEGEDNEDDEEEYDPPSERDRTIAGWGCLVICLLSALGTYILYRSAMNKLADLPEVPQSHQRAERTVTREPVKTVPRRPSIEWNQTLAEATASDDPIMLIFCAEWATACRDMDQTTFANPRVLQASRAFSRVSLDLTATGDTPARQAAQTHEVDGVPHLIFMRADGSRLRGDVTGMIDARDLLVYMSEALQAHEGPL